MPTEIAYGALPCQRADVHLPVEYGAPILVYFHGGGLEAGGRGDNPGLIERLVAAGVGVASADYRLYPEARYPDYLQDAAACVAAVRRELPDRPLVVGGSSAGAYLAMLLCFEQRWLAAARVDVDDIDGWVFDGGQPTTHFNVLRERGLDPRRVVVDEAAPLFHVGERSSLAPTLITLAADDIPGRREQTEVLQVALRDFGLSDAVRSEVIDGFQHSAYLGDDAPAGQARFAGLVIELVGTSAAGWQRRDRSTTAT